LAVTAAAFVRICKYPRSGSDREEIKNGIRMPLMKLISSFWIDEDFIRNDLMLLRSTYILNSARRLFLPVPDFDADKGDNWIYLQDGSGRIHLTLQGQRRLLDAIRAEKAASSERFRLWLAGLTGLVGAITGLIALLFRH
jgi:hypothetical protein